MKVLKQQSRLQTNLGKVFSNKCASSNSFSTLYPIAALFFAAVKSPGKGNRGHGARGAPLNLSCLMLAGLYVGKSGQFLKEIRPKAWICCSGYSGGNKI